MAHWYIKAINNNPGSGSHRNEWATGTAYAIGDRVVCRTAYGTAGARQRVYECTTGGTSHGSTEPTWPTTVGNTVNDNGVIWTCRAPQTWANAHIYLPWISAQSYNIWSVGDSFWIDSTSVQTFTDTGSLTMFGQYYYNPGSATARVHVTSTSDLVNEPPTSRAIGAIIRNAGSIICNECHGAYWYGIQVEAGYGASSGTPVIKMNQYSNAGYFAEFETCTFKLAYAASSATIALTDESTSYDPLTSRFKNCHFLFTHVGQRLVLGAGPSRIFGGSIAATGTVPTAVFQPSQYVRSANLIVVGTDLSQCSSYLVDGQYYYDGRLVLSRCKLNSAVTLCNNKPVQPGPRVIAELCSYTSGVNYRLNVADYAATLADEETYVRTNGASDGTTPISWKIVSNAGNGPPVAFRSPWIAIWQNDVGSSKTFTVEILHDNATALTDNEVWLEAMVLTDASCPKAAYYEDRGNPGFTAANQATSTVEWTTTGMTNPNKQKLSITATPAMKGVVTVRVAVAKPSYTVYVDPMIVVS